jgi:hypothetical protein
VENPNAIESPVNGRPRLKKLSLVALALATTFGLSAVLSAPIKLAGFPAVQSVYELLGARSPGERTSAELTKAKRQKQAPRAGARAAKPSQRALGKINSPALAVGPEPLADSLSEPQSIFSEPLTLQEPLELVGLFPEIDLPGGALGGPAGSSGPGGVIGGGGSGGGSGSGGDGGGEAAEQPGEVNPPVAAINPPVSAVPEPATWTMMILGFGLCAAALRRRSAALASYV